MFDDSAEYVGKYATGFPTAVGILQQSPQLIKRFAELVQQLRGHLTTAWGFRLTSSLMVYLDLFVRRTIMPLAGSDGREIRLIGGSSPLMANCDLFVVGNEEINGTGK